MFASSPGLHGIEHAVYDIWLTDCKGGTEVIAEAKEADDRPVTAQERRRRQQSAQPQPANVGPGGRIDVAPPRGTPVQPQQQPSRRFFPTNTPSSFDPTGGNR